MADHIIPNENGKGFILAFIGDDFEYVNPIDYYADRFIKSRTSMLTHILKLKLPQDASVESLERVAYKNALKDWDEEYKEIISTEIPKNFISLLTSESKDEQIKLLKGQTLTTPILFSLIYKAYSEFGFTYSSYSGEQFHKGLDRSLLPKFATLNRDSGEVKKVGDTSLTDGQIKQAIQQRKRTISKFLDNGSTWHCFIITYDSIGGEERAHRQTHFHYFSDKWTIPREEAVKKIKTGNYPSSKVHIDLLDYGNQTDKK